MPVIRVEARATSESEFNRKLFYADVIDAAEADAQMPAADYGVSPLTNKVVRPSGHSRNTTAALRSKVEKALRARGVKFLIIDEGGHFTNMTEKKMKRQLDALKSLANCAGCQIILLGSYDILGVSRLSAHLARRIKEIHFSRYRIDSADERLFFKRFLNSIEDKADGYFKGLLVENSDLLLRNTLGCIGTLMNLLKGFVSRAEKSGGVTKELLMKSLQTNGQCAAILSEIQEGERRFEQEGYLAVLGGAAACKATDISLPRSILHGLKPIGMGAPEVESLTSYVCRLANSHSCTTNDLTHLIIEKVAPGRWNTYQAADGKSRFVWYERSVSGVGEGALTWASMLSELTGVTGLDKLTLLPLRSVLSPKALMAQQARWCPHCLHEDLAAGRQPYLRLSWDIGLNKTCPKHGVSLISQCPHCDESNVRNNAVFVVPGWCTRCDHFLGCSEHHGPKMLSSDEDSVLSEQSQRVAELLAATSNPESSDFHADLDALHGAVEDLTDELDGGVSVHFAKRLGMQKSTVHRWKTEKTPLTFDALSRLSIHCNVSLPQLVQGKLDKWTPPSELRQLGLQFSYPVKAKNRTPREHDWVAIREKLRAELGSSDIRSLADIAKDLDIDDRHLYIQVTDEARMIGDRYVQHLHQVARQNEKELQAELKQAAKSAREQGGVASVSSVTELLGQSKVNSVRGLYASLARINFELIRPTTTCSSQTTI